MRPRGQAFMSWIVLVLYFASTTVASRSVVVCLEVDGGSAIEFAGDHGQCLGDGPRVSETAQAGHPECRESCCYSCPCEDSSLAIEPALGAKKDPPPCVFFGITPDVLPWTTAQPCLHPRPSPTRPDAAAAVGDVTRRSLRTIVLLL